MLLKYYKLDAHPFGVTPDPRFLFFSPTHREAMASVMHGIVSGRGFTALIAEPGMGKTTLLFNLLQLLKKTSKTAFLFHTLCGPREFLRALLTDLGIEDDGLDYTRMHAKLNEYLLCESLQGRRVVVIIDEAQNLDKQVLEVVRMLSNFETANKKLLHVVLAGQPQLAEKLTSESLVQLQQRISIVARLAPLNEQETRKYIEHRLQIAGFPSDESLFTSKAYSMIAEHSRGIPRNINNLCFNAMSLCCALRRRTVDALMVQETINDLDLATLAHLTSKPINKKTEQRSKVSLSFGERKIFGSVRWQLPVAFAATLLVLLGWPAYRAIKSDGTKLSSRHVEATFQEKTNGNSKMHAERYDKRFLADLLELSLWLKDPQRLPLGQVVRIPVKQQVAAEIQAIREQNSVPPELTPQRENP